MDIEQLRARVRGTIIQPGHAEYESARKVYNAMIDKRPALIVRCVDTADVIASVNYARANDMLTALRGGGHNGAGLSTCDDGLVIDLSRMKGIRVDPAARTVRVEAGCTGGEMDHATHAFGLATPSGTVSTTGMAGLTLGGGIGHLTRPFGLAIDNLLEADVVLADGRFVTVNEKQHADLFWALRGGGGNFGIVTSFLFQLHPVTMVSAGPTFWPIEQTPEVMKAYQEFILQAPLDVSGFLAFLTVPAVPLFPPEIHGRQVCAIIWCSTADPEKAERATKAMRSVGTPLLDHVGPMPFPVLQGLFDPLLPAGMQWYWRADFVKTFGADAIAAHYREALKMPAGLSQVHIYPINGAAQRVGTGDTARRQLCGGHRRHRSRSATEGCDHVVVQGVLRCDASILGWRRLHQLHDGGGPGACAGVVQGQLCPPRPDQRAVRSGESLPCESEHPSGRSDRLTHMHYCEGV
jgi:hypothetical protein